MASRRRKILSRRNRSFSVKRQRKRMFCRTRHLRYIGIRRLAVFTRPLIVNGSCIADNESYSRVCIIHACVCVCRSYLANSKLYFPQLHPFKRASPAQRYGKVDSLIFNFIFYNLPSSRNPLFSFHLNYCTQFELESCFTFDLLFRLKTERYVFYDLLSFRCILIQKKKKKSRFSHEIKILLLLLARSSCPT